METKKDILRPEDGSVDDLPFGLTEEEIEYSDEIEGDDNVSD